MRVLKYWLSLEPRWNGGGGEEESEAEGEAEQGGE